MKGRNRPVFEVISDFGWNVSIAPLDVVSNMGVFGKVVALLLLFIWCLPVLIIFTFASFLFWLIERK